MSIRNRYIGFALAFLIANAVNMPAVEASIASPELFERTNADSTSAGLIRLSGTARENYFETEEGYTVCNVEKDQEQATSWYYCNVTEDGDLAPVLDLQVGSSDPVKAGLAVGMRRSRGKALELCGDLCSEEQEQKQGLRHRRDLLTVPFTPLREGTMKNLVILMRFSDHAAKSLPSVQDINTVMNSNVVDPNNNIAPTGSVKKFYLDNSGSKLVLEFTISSWITLDEKYTEAYCAENNNGKGKAFKECLKNALDKYDATNSFKRFDLNNDGWIDGMTFLHSGYGAEVTGNIAHIWAHHTNMGTWTSSDGVRVNPFVVASSLRGIAGSDIFRIGMFCHEFGHFLGLPDLYDVDNRNGGSGLGVGLWSLMGNCWGFGSPGLNPPQLDPWSKLSMGWGTVTSGVGVQNGITLRPSYTYHEYYKVESGFPNSELEYLLIENRQKIGFDNVPQAGLLIWHIDMNKTNNNEEGHPGQENWPANNLHYKVAVLQADGLFQLEKGLNHGNRHDIFHQGGVNHIGPGPNVYPNTDSYLGGNIVSTGVSISNIKSATTGGGLDMVFDFTPRMYDYQVQVDCHHSRGDLVEGSTNTIAAVFLDASKQVLGQVPFQGTNCNVPVNIDFTTHATVGYLRIENPGIDAFLVDKISVREDGKIKSSHGSDDGDSWCFSSDPADFILSPCVPSYTWDLSTSIYNYASAPFPSTERPDYLGCFMDFKEPDRTMPVKLRPQVSIDDCVRLCRDNGNLFAGLQWKGECWCSNVKPASTVSATECSTPCAIGGGMCGGSYRVSLFDINYHYDRNNYIGCFIDSETRVMPKRITGNSFTIDQCITSCRSYSYDYAGIQYKGECWCGDVYDTLGKAAESECNLPCTKGTGVCGGSWRMSVFSLSETR